MGSVSQRDAQTSEVGHEIRAWPETRLMESESGAPRVCAGPRPCVLGPGHLISGDRGQERQIAHQGLQALSK